MSGVHLRPVQRADLAEMSRHAGPEAHPLDFYGYTSAEPLQRRFDEDGLLTDDRGTLAVVQPDGTLVGTVGWFAVHHGPSAGCRALNIGISVFPDHRGRGYGSAAQAQVAEYLFATTVVERLEATTDVDNVAERRALQKAGFQREGVLRHAQFRDGGWHDAVIYSRLRADEA